MKTHFLILLFISCSFIAVNAQDQKKDPRFEKFLDKVAASKGSVRDTTLPPNANRFFKTYDDYLNNNPSPEIILTDGYEGGRHAVLYVKLNGADQVIRISELQYWGYCTEYGLLCRIYEGRSYLVLLMGKVCQYVQYGKVRGTLNNDSTFTLITPSMPNAQGGTSSAGYEDFASAGANGPILVLDLKWKTCESKTLESLMSDHPEIYKACIEDKGYYLKDKYKQQTRDNMTFKVQHFIRKYNNT
jgi:hypothetical protein